jgi:hypothetical protein
LPDVDGLGEGDRPGDLLGLGLVPLGDGLPLGLWDTDRLGDGEWLGEGDWLGDGPWLGLCDAELVGDALPLGPPLACVLGEGLLVGLREALLVATRSCARDKPPLCADAGRAPQVAATAGALEPVVAANAAALMPEERTKIPAETPSTLDRARRARLRTASPRRGAPGLLATIVTLCMVSLEDAPPEVFDT